MSTLENRSRAAAQTGAPWRIASTRLPTRWGTFEMMGFERDVWTGGRTAETALALVLGELNQGAPLLRVHSQCVTGEVFGSLRCDCGAQLELAMQAIAQEGRGLLIYEYQEGRGIGLMPKLQAYELQDVGIDTIEANHALGFKADFRDFSLAAAILHDLRIPRVRLLTNNPRKVRALSDRGIEVVERIPCEVEPTAHSLAYLQTKKQKMGHALSLDIPDPGWAPRSLKHNCDTKGQTMTVLETTKSKASSGATRSGRLFLLELSGDRIHSMNPDGSDRKTIVSNCHLPDGIVVDAQAGHIYWTNMGVPNLDDGSIERADLDGGNRRIIAPQGVTHTPKQIHLDKESGKLYWCDREGMRVMRANLDGSQVETLVETGRGDKDGRDQMRWCVGITVDPRNKKIYWTQKGPTKGGLGLVCRANIDTPKGESPANRSDIEVLFDKLPEPIDLELDHENRVLYWTDRGDPPRGNTVNRTPIDCKQTEPEVLITHLMEGIGIALDIPGNRMFVTDFAGSVYSADLDGKNKRNFLYAQGNLTGIAYAEV
jgi:GTP cyclohydrolase II